MGCCKSKEPAIDSFLLMDPDTSIQETRATLASCVECRNLFTAINYNRFCSNVCRIKFRKYEIKKVCERCQKIFETNRYDKKYCSKKCEFNKKELIKRCLRCNIEFVTTKKDHEYCTLCYEDNKRSICKTCGIIYNLHYKKDFCDKHCKKNLKFHEYEHKLCEKCHDVFLEKLDIQIKNNKCSKCNSKYNLYVEKIFD